MKNKRIGKVLVIVIILLTMWFSKVLPKQIAKLVAAHYMTQQEGGSKFKLKGVEYSAAHDAYFVYFNHEEGSDEATRNIGIHCRGILFYVYFDSEKLPA